MNVIGEHWSLHMKPGIGVALVSVAVCGCVTGVDREYAQAVRPIGVGGQEAWNRRSVWFMYAPTFDFTNRSDAVKYVFDVTDSVGARHTFSADSAKAPLAPVWADIPVGWTKVVCRAVGADGRPLGAVGSREFGRQPVFRDGAYPHPTKSPAAASRQIARYVMRLPIVKVNYTDGKPVPKEMVNRGNQVFVAYPSKMGAAVLSAMANLAANDPECRTEALACAEGVFRKMQSITEAAGAPLAGFPRTYEPHAGLIERVSKVVAQNKDRIMLLYPALVGSSYLDLYAQTRDPAKLAAAVRIAERYLALQGGDGTWPLNCRLSDGRAMGPNRLVPMDVIEFFERLHALTGEAKYRSTADRAFAYIENGPLRTWNWEGQFEDIEPTEKFVNLTEHGPCDVAIYLLKRFPGDARRIAQAREIARFAEDQFVCWENPLYAEKHLIDSGFGVWGDQKAWRCPCALEQYNCYVPIDSSAAKILRTFLALYRAEGREADLAKARTLGEALVRETDETGYLPTFWFNHRQDWPNCMVSSSNALAELAEAVK